MEQHSQEGKPHPEVRASNRYLSRTFLVTIIWILFVPITIILNIIFAGRIPIPLETLLTLSGTISLTYVGGEKARDTFWARGQTVTYPSYSNPSSYYPSYYQSPPSYYSPSVPTTTVEASKEKSNE